MKRLLIVQLGRIGDMILATPIFHAIKEKYPDSEIYVLAGRHNALILQNNPFIKKVLVYDKRPVGLLSLLMELNKLKFDYHIDPKDHYSTESRLIAGIVNATHKIGYNRLKSKVFDILIPSSEENSGLHFTERCFNAIIPLGIELPATTPKPELYPPNSSEIFAEKFIYDFTEKPIIVLNISASHERKMWDNEKWTFVLENLPEIERFNVVLCHAPTETDRAVDLIRRCKKLILYRSRNLFDVISLVKRSKLLITPDTSIVHVAAAFDIPLAGLFSGLDDFYDKFHPLSTKYSAVHAPVGEGGIARIEPIEVVDAVRKMIKELDLETI